MQHLRIEWQNVPSIMIDTWSFVVFSRLDYDIIDDTITIGNVFPPQNMDV